MQKSGDGNRCVLDWRHGWSAPRHASHTSRSFLVKPAISIGQSIGWPRFVFAALVPLHLKSSNRGVLLDPLWPLKARSAVMLNRIAINSFFGVGTKNWPSLIPKKQSTSTTPTPPATTFFFRLGLPVRLCGALGQSTSAGLRGSPPTAVPLGGEVKLEGAKILWWTCVACRMLLIQNSPRCQPRAYSKQMVCIPMPLAGQCFEAEPRLCAGNVCRKFLVRNAFFVWGVVQEVSLAKK